MELHKDKVRISHLDNDTRRDYFDNHRATWQRIKKQGRVGVINTNVSDKLVANNLTILEHKLFETDFFLDKIKECKKNTETHRQAEYYFSAFLSSSRSVTFVMQSAFSKLPGFTEWYSGTQDILKKSEIARFFVEARNSNQKEGLTYFNITRLYQGEVSFYFVNDGEFKFAPTDDIVDASEQYFRLLLSIVSDFFIQFGDHVDPKKYYSKDKLIERGQTVKQLEYEVWGYNKWTSFGLSDEKVLDYITNWMYITNIDSLFDKYKDVSR